MPAAVAVIKVKSTIKKEAPTSLVGKKIAARLLFALPPAVFVGLLCALIHPVLGVIIAAGIGYFSLGLTAPHSERGEGLGKK